MRKYALTVPNTSHEIKKIMIYETADNGVYLFVYQTQKDEPSHNDFWFDHVEDAENFSEAYFRTSENGWVQIDDPVEGCQHDLIRPIRRIDNTYEILEKSVWKKIEL
ncbi:hypothetical protein GZH47_00330 [Paenibacillus rhizovicinus]|uniref:Uncharacterized protein n=1 Tax=Paenibacillus rhizovicinus TaxID=2704463 RepID=A0A6C0NTE1_9BACL|nr:hypothetical protein [Paenibacillus rhizovicinus]QHW29427.1 hypothetical protein GZH47_00330 [Paenibacillus rhizovicinus]